jgi:hypothetical protein
MQEIHTMKQEEQDEEGLYQPYPYNASRSPGYPSNNEQEHNEHGVYSTSPPYTLIVNVPVRRLIVNNRFLAPAYNGHPYDL